MTSIKTMDIVKNCSQGANKYTMVVHAEKWTLRLPANRRQVDNVHEKLAVFLGEKLDGKAPEIPVTGWNLIIKKLGKSLFDITMSVDIPTEKRQLFPAVFVKGTVDKSILYKLFYRAEELRAEDRAGEIAPDHHGSLYRSGL